MKVVSLSRKIPVVVMTKSAKQATAFFLYACMSYSARAIMSVVQRTAVRRASSAPREPVVRSTPICSTRAEARNSRTNVPFFSWIYV